MTDAEIDEYAKNIWQKIEKPNKSN
jgi:hypothetical protein